MSDTELTVSHPVWIKVDLADLHFTGLVGAMVWDRLPAGRKVIRRAALPTTPAESLWDRSCGPSNAGPDSSNRIGGSIEVSLTPGSM